jgi:hypothetical protein
MTEDDIGIFLREEFLPLWTNTSRRRLDELDGRLKVQSEVLKKRKIELRNWFVLFAWFTWF